MSSVRKHISEKKIIANAFKQYDKIFSHKKNDESELLDKVVDACTDKGKLILAIMIDKQSRGDCVTNIGDEPNVFAKILAGLIVRLASDTGISTDSFISKIIAETDIFTEKFLSGKMWEKMKEEV